jgi:hypothetical protein
VQEDLIENSKVDKERLKEGNPFIESGFKVIVNRKKDVNIQVRDGMGGWEPLEQEYERAYATKIYTEINNRKVVQNLNASAKDIYLFILYKMTWGQDWVVIKKKRYMEAHNVGSINTFKKGMVNLIEKKFICASSVKDVYWINPKFFFCGSRANKYPDLVEEYQPKHKKESDNA